MKLARDKAIEGCLVGTAVGDSIGLPFEGISAPRVHRLIGEAPLRHRFVFGRGMISDDTEHAAMTAQALIGSGGDPERFERLLAWKLRWWLLGLPAGIGLATLRSILKLWLGFRPASSGVYSAGNGPAMRSAIIGVAYGHDSDKLIDLVRRSTRITHKDPKAFRGALAVAVCAHIAAQTPDDSSPVSAYFEKAQEVIGQTASPGEEFLELLRSVENSLASAESTTDFARTLGLEKGVTGYINHTLPVVLHAWLSHPSNFEAAVTAAIRCGGDSDTVGAITGGIAGSAVGVENIPKPWRERIAEYPRNVRWLKRVAARLGEVADTGKPSKQVFLNPLSVFLRNLIFMVLVLGHGFRRLLPPY